MRNVLVKKGVTAGELNWLLSNFEVRGLCFEDGIVGDDRLRYPVVLETPDQCDMELHPRYKLWHHIEEQEGE